MTKSLDKCPALGEVESMIKFQQEIDTGNIFLRHLWHQLIIEKSESVTLGSSQKITVLRGVILTNLRTRSRCLILPVPVVFLLLAFTDHPNLRILAEGKPQAEHTFFWMWRVTYKWSI